jgi:hypothetical protein
MACEERMADAGDDEEGVVMVPFELTKDLINALIERGDCTDILRAVKVYQELLDRMRPGKTAVLCANCARKIGCFRCSRCDKTSSVRYCGRACQEAHWGKHRLECAGIMRV